MSKLYSQAVLIFSKLKKISSRQKPESRTIIFILKTLFRPVISPVLFTACVHQYRQKPFFLKDRFIPKVDICAINGKRFFLCSILLWTSLAQSRELFAYNNNISFECIDRLVEDCLETLGNEAQVVVSIPEGVVSRLITISLEKVSMVEGLDRILSVAGMENYTITYDSPQNMVLVSFVAPNGEGVGAVQTKNKLYNHTRSKEETRGRGGANPPLAPGPDEVRAAAQQKIDNDTIIMLPGGQVTTPRQLLTFQAKAETYSPPLDSPVLPQEGSPTFRQLQVFITSGKIDSQQNLTITMPDGKDINSKIFLEKTTKHKTDAPK